MRTSIALTVLALCLAGCVGGPVDKGEEENAPLDGKADGWDNVTEHGVLHFGTSSYAELSEEEPYHAWGFTLSGTADVVLEVLSSDTNLDTVMYLYRKRDDGGWGRYVRRDDDQGERMLSKIVAADDRALEEGEYRIIVKGFKPQHAGTFSMSGACDGDGCRSPDPGGDVVVPAETGFTQACVNRLWDSIGSNLVTSSAFSIRPTATSGFDHPVLVANAHYAALSDWSEYADEPEEFTFDVEYWVLESGFVVEMADGGDESTTDYTFDADGNLLSYFVHNQSPWMGFFCGDDGEEQLGDPDEDCMSAWTNMGPRASGSVYTGTETWVPGEPNDEIDSLMDAALTRYFETENEGNSDLEVSIEYTSWEGPDGDRGAELLLDGGVGVADVAYAVVDHWDGPIIVFESSENDDEGQHMRCLQ